MKTLLFMIFRFIVITVTMPIAMIWSVNTLFPSVNIPITFATWLAALVWLAFFFYWIITLDRLRGK